MYIIGNFQSFKEMFCLPERLLEYYRESVWLLCPAQIPLQFLWQGCPDPSFLAHILLGNESTSGFREDHMIHASQSVYSIFLAVVIGSGIVRSIEVKEDIFRDYGYHVMGNRVSLPSSGRHII